MGHTPSTAGTFRKKFQRNSGKTPETLSQRFLEFPSRVRLECPKPYNSRAFPDFFFSEVVPERASQSWSWNFQQYWGVFLTFACTLFSSVPGPSVSSCLSELNQRFGNQDPDSTPDPNVRAFLLTVRSYPDSVLTLYGLILAPISNFSKLPFWVLGS